MPITTIFEAAVILVALFTITVVVIWTIPVLNEQAEEDRKADEAAEKILREELDYHSNGGDPLIINHTNRTITIPPLDWTVYCLPDRNGTIYPCWDIEGHDYQDKLFYFDYNCDGKNQPGDRNPVGTLTLYIDYDKSESITNGCEVMWSYYTPVHEILKEMDSNQDGMISPLDDIWEKVRMSNWDESWTPKELGYQHFDLTGYIDVQHDDCHGFIGTYADGADGFVKDAKYYECIEHGWSPIEPITDSHLRIVGYNDCGGYHEEYGCVRIYSGVLGYWEKTGQ